jgi:alcohol dehydrogenase YqhD (iron-dependent ADH family)
MSFNMYVPTRFIFGCGRLSELHEQKLPGKKAMVVISNGKSTKENGSLDLTVVELSKAGAQSVVFDQVQANPLKSTLWQEQKQQEIMDVTLLLHLVEAALWMHPRQWRQWQQTMEMSGIIFPVALAKAKRL